VDGFYRSIVTFLSRCIGVEIGEVHEHEVDVLVSWTCARRLMPLAPLMRRSFHQVRSNLEGKILVVLTS